MNEHKAEAYEAPQETASKKKNAKDKEIKEDSHKSIWHLYL